jgi:type II secretory pathway component PulC
MSASPASGDNSVHPMLRLSLDQYFVKGVVTSSKGSLAIVSFPGGDDYFLYVGDPIGNDEHSLKSISIDGVTFEKEGADEVEKQVFNPVQTITGSDMQ